MRPLLGPITQVRQVTGRTDAGFLDISMTPHGFLKAAAANNATVKTGTVGGKKITTVSFAARGKYTVTGTLNDQNLVERVATLVDNPVVGDMPIDITYSDYRDFGGLKFPAHIVRREAGQPTLDLTVTDVQPDGAPSLEVRDAAAPAAPQPVRVQTQKIGDGAWALTAGGLSSVLVEFNDHLVVVEAPGNDERSNAVIVESRRLVPGKPIRYLVNTHAHFDHSGGVRAFAAQGVTIITQEINKPYFERVYRNPHRINPDNLALSKRGASIEGFADRRVLTDGMQRLELYHVRGNLHHDGLLIAYLPNAKVVIQADAFHPRPGAPPYPSPPQFTANLVENIQRLKLDVTQVVHIHGGMDSFAAVAKAASPAS
jgi:glyoxylase-like metal-dependent hydrolase (beta-lactamase superfamily II)